MHPCFNGLSNCLQFTNIPPIVVTFVTSQLFIGLLFKSKGNSFYYLRIF